MTRFFLSLLVLVAVGSLSGCGWGSKKPKSAAHLYEGDAPTIKYSDEPETAGGAIRSY